jgi:pimeloyl-ACP methyl ester carboxylesterase
VSSRNRNTSFSDDVVVLPRVLLRQEGPVVLAGHSYGGAVITAAAAGNPNVKALIYIAVIVPDEGETVGDVFHRVPAHPSAPKLQPDVDGFLWVKVDAYRSAVAPDASSSETALMAATQKPIAQVPRGAHEHAGLERKTDLVSYRRKGPNGISRNATFHGRENEVQICFFACRSYSLGFKA